MSEAQKPIVMGVDPASDGFYFACVTRMNNGKYFLHGFGNIKGSYEDVVRTVVDAIETYQPQTICVEALADWLSDPKRFGHLVSMAEVNGIVRAVAIMKGVKVEGLSVGQWRRTLRIHGKEQDKQVKAMNEMLLDQFPRHGSGFVGHHNDALGIAIAAEMSSGRMAEQVGMFAIANPKKKGRIYAKRRAG